MIRQFNKDQRLVDGTKSNRFSIPQIIQWLGVALSLSLCTLGHSYAAASQKANMQLAVENNVAGEEGGASTDASEPTIDINSATVMDLATMLPGIGPEKAQRIVLWRNANGPFQFKQQLLQVKGIGAKTLERIADYFHVGDGVNRFLKNNGNAQPEVARANVLADIVRRANQDSNEALGVSGSD